MLHLKFSEEKNQAGLCVTWILVNYKKPGYDTDVYIIFQYLSPSNSVDISISIYKVTYVTFKDRVSLQLSTFKQNEFIFHFKITS